MRIMYIVSVIASVVVNHLIVSKVLRLCVLTIRLPIFDTSSRLFFKRFIYTSFVVLTSPIKCVTHFYIRCESRVGLKENRILPECCDLSSNISNEVR